ncbi:hypothetical protein SAMN04488029_0449 [Reichenbachiella faecimaris]|uniref:Viral A-type inclusion protein n=1 Tax=Reichenbachiella faecimaris TaxID=692418 RepID=A0A1W2G604_REIFA|nr:hypothetical protein [Reichenbachiella faecimaris]SMD32109.1 hypothetical protein SAMN04488029_0449 [Reichenbachiella faecimaris]
MINRINNVLISGLIALTVVACNSEKKEQQALFDEVMLVHDEVMPKMGNLRALASELSQKADSLALDSLTDSSEEINEMRSLSKKLKDANEGMMEWMRKFEQVKEGTPHGEVIQYLKEQRESIQKVRDDMINSKNEAEKYLLENN